MPSPKEALQELLEVATYWGDNALPHPADDPLPWTARMQDAWEDVEAAIPVAELHEQMEVLLKDYYKNLDEMVSVAGKDERLFQRLRINNSTIIAPKLREILTQLEALK